MAEIRNTFIKSKMNKDLDDRLLPTGEYRDAQNVAISRSEGDDVGALENILGNELISVTSITGSKLSIIGNHVSEATSCIYFFITNFTDASSLGDTFASNDSLHYIYEYNKITQVYTKLIEGYFLNFSKTKPVIGVNLLETFLFWTDNRNQPRKINITRALSNSSYYNNEDSVSVARYNPWKSISLTNAFDLAPGVSPTQSTMVNPANKTLPNGATALTNQAGTIAAGDPFAIDHFVGNQVTDTPVNPFASPLVYNNFILVGQTVTGTGVPAGTVVSTVVGSAAIPTAPTSITLNNPITVTDNVSIIFNINPDYDSSWAGDPSFLEDKFARFSYRFKFEDNTYSLMAPFTQVAYIPKQQGYFLSGDQENAYQSTIVNWFENNVAQITLGIEFESTAPSVAHKVSSLDILYKESDGLVVKVIESIPISEVETAMTANANTKIYNYKYISTKPYKTLTQAQTTRVYDKVPTRALAQEITSNRITYGNFYNEQSPPISLDYRVGYADKTLALGSSEIEYPNHTVKQNRNYQVGVVLADRFGRQSSVILSSQDTSSTSSGVLFGGSTIYLPYKDETGSSIINWPGYALRTLFNSPIPSQISTIQGYPGLYKDANNAIDGFIIFNAGTGYSVANDVECTGLDAGMFVNITSVSAAGAITGVTLSSQPPEPSETVRNNARVIVDAGNNDAVLQLIINPPNPLGWYSYKIVVRQTEQDYYNSYIPGILNGYPSNYVTSPPGGDTTFEQGQTANIVLINDNINKIPRDLSEIGPDQKQYRSSVRLFGRVSPRETVGSGNTNAYNMQWYPDVFADTVTSISTLRDSNFNGTGLDTITDPNINYVEFYQSETNPSIARISTKNTFEPIDNGTTTQLSIGKVNTGAIVTPATYTLIIADDLERTANTTTGYTDNKNVATPIIQDGGTYTGNATFFLTINNVGEVKSCQVRSTGSTDSIDPLGKTITFSETILQAVFGIGGTGEVTFTITANCIDTVASFTVQNAYPLNLAVYETSPVESLLDIYWETSTTGIISELNAAIITGGYPGAVEVTGYTVDFDEGDGAPLTTAQFSTSEVTSNSMTVNDSTGAIIPSVTFSSLQVFDDAGTDRSLEFDLQPLGIGTIGDPNSFKIWTKPGAFFYYGTQPNPRNFTMTVQCSVVSGTETFVSDVSIDVPLANISPIFLKPGASSNWPTIPTVVTPVLCPQIDGCAAQPVATVGVTDSSSSQVVFTFYAGNGSNCLGGVAQDELTFTFSGAATTAVTDNFTLAQNTIGVCSISAIANAAAGTYLIPVTVTDAGGAVDSCSVTIVIYSVSGGQACRSLTEVLNYGSTVLDITDLIPSCEDGTYLLDTTVPASADGITPGQYTIAGGPKCVRFAGWLAPNLEDNFDNGDGTGWGVENIPSTISWGFANEIDCAQPCTTYLIRTGSGDASSAGTFSWTDCNNVARGPIDIEVDSGCFICTRYVNTISTTSGAALESGSQGPCTTPGPLNPPLENQANCS